MEFFPDRMHVRLRSRVHGGYLHTDEDGVGVSLSPHRTSLNTAWVLHRVQRDGNDYVLLHSAAYGRYLAFSREQFYAGHAVVQCIYYNDIEQGDLLWEAVRYRGDDLFLLNRNHGPWRMVWMVEGIPSRGVPPLLPPPTPASAMFRRMILYMQGDEYGNIDFQSTRLLVFEGRSVSHLRNELAACLEEWYPVRITMCVWAGSHGRLTPLVIDLPANNETIEIVVFVSWSRAALEFRHPYIDGP